MQMHETQNVTKLGYLAAICIGIRIASEMHRRRTVWMTRYPARCAKICSVELHLNQEGCNLVRRRKADATWWHCSVHAVRWMMFRQLSLTRFHCSLVSSRFDATVNVTYNKNWNSYNAVYRVSASIGPLIIYNSIQNYERIVSNLVGCRSWWDGTWYISHRFILQHLSVENRLVSLPRKKMVASATIAQFVPEPQTRISVSATFFFILDNCTWILSIKLKWRPA